MTDYSELMKRLREIKDWWREPGHTAEMAADALEAQEKEIAQLKRDSLMFADAMADLTNRTNELRARIKELEAALKPFSNIDKSYHASKPYWYGIQVSLPLDDLRRARTALNKTD